MIPQIHFTKHYARAWFPSVQAAQGLADFCNFYWRARGDEYYFADIVEEPSGHQACVRVTYRGDFITYIQHPDEELVA